MRNAFLWFIVGLLLVSACARQPSNVVGGGSEIQQNAQAPTQNGEVKEFKITARQFAFEPATIEVNKGDKVRLIVTSADVTHGIAIPEYGINERLDVGKPVTVEFTADKQGTFTAFCSVACGPGHRDMKGSIVVK